VLGFLPIFILIGAAIAVAVLNFVPRGIGIAWFVSIIASLAAWIILLVSKNQLPNTFSNTMFMNLGITYIIPSFQIDLIIWPILLTILAVANSALITSSARIGLNASCWEWSGLLMLGALGYLACISSNVLTGILALGLFDLVDIVILLFSGNTIRDIRQNTLHVFWRFSSLFLLLTSFAWNSSFPKATGEWESLQAGPALLVFAACFLRMTVWPSIKIGGLPRTSLNGLFYTRLFLGLLIACSIVIQLPTFSASVTTRYLLLSYLLLVLFIAVFWLIQNREEVRPVAWQVLIACIVSAEYIYGFSASAILFVACIIPVTLILFLDYPTSRFSKGIGFLAILAFSGFPYTPNNSGLAGLSLIGQIPGILFIPGAIAVFFFMIKDVLQKEYTGNPNGERWTIAFAPLGLILPLVSPWIIAYLWQPNPLRFNISIQAMIMALSGIGIFIAIKFHIFEFNKSFEPITEKIHVVKKRLGNTIPEKITFDSSIIESPFNFIVTLFEGEGGFLWALLCLILIITVISTFGQS
jgi:hypothetical protein